jgi:hypothetical protein
MEDTVPYSGEKLCSWQYRPLWKSVGCKSVARNQCIPVEKILRRTLVKFCVVYAGYFNLILYYFLFPICVWYKLKT